MYVWDGGGILFGFFGGLFAGSRGGGWEFSWVWVVASGILRAVVACEGGSCFGLGGLGFRVYLCYLCVKVAAITYCQTLLMNS